MMRYLPSLPASIILVFFAWSPTTLPADEAVRFNRDIRPILSDKCFVCHGPAKQEGEVRLDDRKVAVDSGALTPGKASESTILSRVRSHDPDERMPPPTSKLEPLTEQEIALLTKWIEQGAPYEGHWSFIPLQKVGLPKTPQPSHPIDAIVWEGLRQRGIERQREADKHALIRRLAFDLTGLPPTVEEVQTFVKDESPEAYSNLVDRMLNSKHYGERMAVDWLDVARYADSYGFQVDREREMWPWRDWVVQAFNENLPFDRFITWQIAGDLLPNPTDEQILATAFNRLHQQESEGGSVEEEYRVEYVCDRVQTFATAFLGLTFECARCHDHKYDPITQKEYYQFFSMFQNIDEAGLYSFFTNSPPTPTLWLTDAQAKNRLAELRDKVSEFEAKQRTLSEIRRAEFEVWMTAYLSGEISGREKRLQDAIAQRELGHFSFDRQEGNKLENSIVADQPATIKGDNRLVAGKSHQAILFTGDDPVDLSIGNFSRHEPFSISLWMKTPDEKQRGVIFHRSRAWTDAASRGYELLIEDGKLKWSLIHFWPGNAISVATKNKVDIDTWTHVVVTSDGSSRADGLKIFVNGKLASIEIVKDHLTKEITGGGGDHIALGERFRDRGFKGGLIDEFRVFGRELTSMEALAIFDFNEAKQILANDLGSLSKEMRQQLLEFYLATQDEESLKTLEDLKTHRGNYMKQADSVREIMVMQELSQPKKAYVLARGEYDQRREEVGPGTPQALSPFPKGAPRNRLGLAQWLTQPDHPLTARVTVNRIWQSLFGRGLVRTSEDFGSQGARPYYPDLIDWLALEFIDSGWDMKKLIKTIVMSETYRQRSYAGENLMKDDPENELLARGPRFRLPAEMIRDNALSVAGLLNRKLGGMPVHPYEMSESFKPSKPGADDSVYRRSLYTNWRRTGPPPAMVAFDAPRRQVCTAKRERTDSPLQALILMNGIQYVEAARVLGESLYRDCGGDLDRMIEEGFLRCLSHPPSLRERQILLQLYQEQREHFSKQTTEAEKLLAIGNSKRDTSIPAADAAAATVLAQALLNHDYCVVKR